MTPFYHTAREISPSNIPPGLSLGARLQPLHDGLIGLSNTLGLAESTEEISTVDGHQLLTPINGPSYLVNGLYSTPYIRLIFVPFIGEINQLTNDCYNFGLLGWFRTPFITIGSGFTFAGFCHLLFGGEITKLEAATEKGTSYLLQSLAKNTPQHGHPSDDNQKP